MKQKIGRGGPPWPPATFTDCEGTHKRRHQGTHRGAPLLLLFLFFSFLSFSLTPRTLWAEQPGDGEGGICLPCDNTANPCNDGNPCTDESCIDLADGSEGCDVKPNNNNPCSDGNACTTPDRCVNGVCQGGAQITCPDDNDGNICTGLICDATTGNCTSTNVAGPCDDGNPCTVNDNCVGGVCRGSPKVCDDQDSCTDNSCNPQSGQCQFNLRQQPLARCSKTQACPAGNNCNLTTCLCEQLCSANKPLAAGGQCKPDCPAGQACDADCSCKVCPGAGNACTLNCPGGQCVIGADGKCVCRRNCSAGPKQPGELCRNDCPQGAACNENCVCEQSCSANKGAPPGGVQCKNDCPLGMQCNLQQCKCERPCSQGPKQPGEICIDNCPQNTQCDQNTCVCRQPCNANAGKPPQGVQCQPNCPQNQACSPLNCSCIQCPIVGRCTLQCPGGSTCVIKNGQCSCERRCAAGPKQEGETCRDDCPNKNLGVICDQNTCTCQQPCQAGLGKPPAGVQCQPQCPDGQACNANCGCVQCPAAGGGCPANFCPPGTECKIENGQCKCERLCSQGPKQGNELCRNDCPQGAVCNQNTCVCEQSCAANIPPPAVGVCKNDCPQGQACNQNCNCQQCPGANGACTLVCPGGACVIRNGQCKCERLCSQGPMKPGEVCKPVCPNGAVCDENTCTCQQPCDAQLPGPIAGAQCNDNCPQGQGCNGNCNCQQCPINNQCPANFCPAGTQCQIQNGRCVCEQPCAANVGQVLPGAQCKDNCPQGAACNLNTCTCEQPCNANAGQIIQGAQCKPNCPAGQGCEGNTCTCKVCPINGQCPANFCPQGTKCVPGNNGCVCEQLCSANLGQVINGAQCKDNCPQGSACNLQTCTCQQRCDANLGQIVGGAQCLPNCPQGQGCEGNTCTCKQCPINGQCPANFCPAGTKCVPGNNGCVCEQLCSGNVGQVLNGAQCKNDCPQGAVCNQNTCTCEQPCNANLGQVIQGAQCKPNCPAGKGCDGNTCSCKVCPVNGQCPANFCPAGTKCVPGNNGCVCEQPCSGNVGQVLNGAQCKNDCPQGSACNLNKCVCEQPCDANAGQVIQGAQCKPNCPAGKVCEGNTCSCKVCPVNGQCNLKCPNNTKCVLDANNQCKCERPCSKGPLQQGEICKDDCAQGVGAGSKCDPVTCTCSKIPCDQTAPQCGGDCPVAPKVCKPEAGGCQCKTPVLCTKGVAPGQGEFCKPDCPKNQKNKICDPAQCKCVECLVAGDCPDKVCQKKECKDNVCVYTNIGNCGPGRACPAGQQCQNCNCVAPGQPGPGPGFPFPPRPGPGGFPPGGGGPGGGGGGGQPRPQGGGGGGGGPFWNTDQAPSIIGPGVGGCPAWCLPDNNEPGTFNSNTGFWECKNTGKVADADAQADLPMDERDPAACFTSKPAAQAAPTDYRCSGVRAQVAVIGDDGKCTCYKTAIPYTLNSCLPKPAFDPKGNVVPNMRTDENEIVVPNVPGKDNKPQPADEIGDDAKGGDCWDVGDCKRWPKEKDVSESCWRPLMKGECKRTLGLWPPGRIVCEKAACVIPKSVTDAVTDKGNADGLEWISCNCPGCGDGILQRDEQCDPCTKLVCRGEPRDPDRRARDCPEPEAGAPRAQCNEGTCKCVAPVAVVQCPPDVMKPVDDILNNDPELRAAGEEERESWTEKASEWILGKKAWAALDSVNQRIQEAIDKKTPRNYGFLIVGTDGQIRQAEKLTLGGGLADQGKIEAMIAKLKDELKCEETLRIVCGGKWCREEEMKGVLEISRKIQKALSYFGGAGVIIANLLDRLIRRYVDEWVRENCKDCADVRPVRLNCCSGVKVETPVECDPKKSGMEVQCAKMSADCKGRDCSCNEKCQCVPPPKCDIVKLQCEVSENKFKLLRKETISIPGTGTGDIYQAQIDLCKKVSPEQAEACCPKDAHGYPDPSGNYQLLVDVACEPGKQCAQIAIPCPCPAHCSYTMRATGMCFHNVGPVGYSNKAVNVEVTGEGDATKCKSLVELTVTGKNGSGTVTIDQPLKPDVEWSVDNRGSITTHNWPVNNWENIPIHIGTTAPRDRIKTGCVHVKAVGEGKGPIQTVVRVAYVDTTEDEVSGTITPGEVKDESGNPLDVEGSCNVRCVYAHACKVEGAEPSPSDFVRTELKRVETSGKGFEITSGGGETAIGCKYECPRIDAFSGRPFEGSVTEKASLTATAIGPNLGHLCPRLPVTIVCSSVPVVNSIDCLDYKFPASTDDYASSSKSTEQSQS